MNLTPRKFDGSGISKGIAELWNTRMSHASLALVLSVFLILVLYPIAVVEIPALGDYLNHLARTHIVANIDYSENLQRYYQVDWRPVPYLVMDVMIPPLTRWMSVYDAGRVFIGICVVMPVLGVCAIQYASSRKIGLAPLVACLFCYNYILSWGFLSYLFSTYLSLLLFAGWLATTKWPRWPRVLMFSLATLILYFSHVFGFGVYCILVAGYEIGHAWRERLSARTIIKDWLAAACQAILGVLLWVFVDRSGTFVGPVQTEYGSLAEKLTALKSPALFSGGRLDDFILISVFGCLALGIILRLVRFDPKILPSIAGLALVTLATPHMLFGVWGDVRLPIILVMLLFASLSIELGRAGTIVFITVLGALLIVRTITVTNILLEAEAVIDDAREVVSDLPRGSSMLVVEAKGPEAARKRVLPWQMTSQIANTAVIDRDAFIPFLFSGVVAVKVKDQYLPSSTPSGHPISLESLYEGIQHSDGGDVSLNDGQGRRIYWYGWSSKFEYVLLQHYGVAMGAIPENLDLIKESKFVNLYKVGAH